MAILEKLMGRLLQSRGSGGMLPQENFFIRDLFRSILRVFLNILKHITFFKHIKAHHLAGTSKASINQFWIELSKEQ